METPTRLRTDGPLRATLVAIGLTVFGIAATQFTTLPAFLLEPALIDSPAETSIGMRSAFLALNFLGFVLAGAIYLAATDRGWAYVDLRMPTMRGWLYTLGGIVGSIAFFVAVSLIIQLVSAPTAENQVMDIVGGDQTMVLVMIVIVFFFNAPAEEFLFRNIVQKRLYTAFTRLQSVLVASLIFALVHFPVYYVTADSLVATSVSLSVVFGGSIIFGYLYAKTDNLVVPTVAHAAFNAVQFGLLYLALAYDIEEAEPAPSLFVDAIVSLL
ncbi:CPBP family intramembrane metalloprotease [Natrarchaeobius halalkaliphilus]|uniref:CPBP family intramembrane metalloprotease n=1 Tax=Natrarchaeobius halalkaliphilus TaxID=1679091 RepID=A0A3N6P560_9EURY|nr:CPBP family intramembrane glutamic endopeptidase [Natrarchaeobius halalkaliphilus]RQG93199.1 CPBP family intramembrane metalloprotease [Natrarchaeobius halalkaliphilus]